MAKTSRTENEPGSRSPKKKKYNSKVGPRNVTKDFYQQCHSSQTHIGIPIPTLQHPAEEILLEAWMPSQTAETSENQAAGGILNCYLT